MPGTIFGVCNTARGEKGPNRCRRICDAVHYFVDSQNARYRSIGLTMNPAFMPDLTRMFLTFFTLFCFMTPVSWVDDATLRCGVDRFRGKVRGTSAGPGL